MNNELLNKIRIFNENQDIELKMNQFKYLVTSLRSISSIHGLGKNNPSKLFVLNDYLDKEVYDLANKYFLPNKLSIMSTERKDIEDLSIGIYFQVGLVKYLLFFDIFNIEKEIKRLETLIKKLRKESKGFIDDLYKCNCIAQLVDLNEKIIAE